MKKIVIHRPGDFEQLRVESHPDPVAGPGEILIDVRAIGINYADCLIRMGLYASAKAYVGYPITPGFEVAGTVCACGPDTEGLPIGTPVIGLTRFGGYASRIAVPVSQVFVKPEALTFEEAAAFPSVFLTAWYGLIRLGAARPGHSVLIHSAGGGVGSSLVQLATLHQGRVLGIVGAPHKRDLVRSLGADAVIDTSTEDLWAVARRFAPGGFDLVLDANGRSTLRQSYAHLAPSGRLIVYGFHSMLPRRKGLPNRLRLAIDYLRTPRFNPFHMTQHNHSVLAFNLSYLFDQGDLLAAGMSALLDWVAEGRIRVAAVTAYPLARAADAHRDLQSAQTQGKLVLIP